MPSKPVFIYDGDCAFCKFWVGRWKKRVGDAVRFAPYQEEAKNHPDIPESVFQSSSQLLLPDGGRYKGAAGAFRLFTYGKQLVPWMWMYERVPGFAWISERVYKWVSSCRVCAMKVTQMFFPSARK